EALAKAGAALVPVPVARAGLDTSFAIKSSPKGRLAVVTPSHQCPLGVTLSLPRRLELLAWAAKTGAWIVEDDYDSEFRYRGHPLPALKSLDEADRVFYAGSQGPKSGSTFGLSCRALVRAQSLFSRH